jgi:hypothetical protein
MSLERALGAALVGIVLWAASKSTKRASPEIQRLFERFHDTIKLEENDGRLKLRTKRELLLKTLRKKMAAHSLAFEAFDQGSYAMRTGVVPKDGNYDIDVGLVFDCPQERFRNPVELKLLVHDALAENNRTVSIRRACVTVTYCRDGVPDYHVDLALYLKGTGDKLLLAKGKMHSQANKCEWVTAAPKELTQYVLSKFSGDEQAQFRRCTRYLKRWRDEKFTVGAPVSVALTVAAAMWFEPKVAEDGSSCDLAALHVLVKKMKNNFGNNLKFTGLVIPLPGVQDIDLLSRLSAPQMTAFKKCLSSLDDALSKCYEDVPVATAAEVLRSQFGVDFPAA